MEVQASLDPFGSAPSTSAPTDLGPPPNLELFAPPAAEAPPAADPFATASFALPVEQPVATDAFQQSSSEEIPSLNLAPTS